MQATLRTPRAPSRSDPMITWSRLMDLMELTREDVEIVKSKVSFLDILLLICGIASVTIGIVIATVITYSWSW